MNSMKRMDIISKSNTLKQQIFNSLKSHCEEIIFYIKDRNYPCFVEKNNLNILLILDKFLLLIISHFH